MASNKVLHQLLNIFDGDFSSAGKEERIGLLKNARKLLVWRRRKLSLVGFLPSLDVNLKAPVPDKRGILLPKPLPSKVRNSEFFKLVMIH